MRAWYAVALFASLGVYALFVVTSAPHDQYDWLFFGLPFVWVVLLVFATRAASFLASARMRAGVEATLVAWTALGAVLGLIGATLPRLVDGGPRRETLMQDTLLWFGAGALASLIPALAVGALVAFAASSGWITHLSPFKRSLGA